MGPVIKLVKIEVAVRIGTILFLSNNTGCRTAAKKMFSRQRESFELECENGSEYNEIIQRRIFNSYRVQVGLSQNEEVTLWLLAEHLFFQRTKFKLLPTGLFAALSSSVLFSMLENGVRLVPINSAKKRSPQIAMTTIGKLKYTHLNFIAYGSARFGAF